MLCSAVFLRLDHIIKDVLMVVAILVYIVLMHFPKTQTFDAFDNHLHFTDNATLPNDRLDLLCAVAPPPPIVV